MSDIENNLKDVVTNILSMEKEELNRMSQEDLEKFWFFEMNVDLSDATNLYNFISMLELYKGKCRRWEELHNGNCCVVERVRDKYLMPKIKQYLKNMNYV